MEHLMVLIGPFPTTLAPNCVAPTDPATICVAPLILYLMLVRLLIRYAPANWIVPRLDDVAAGTAVDALTDKTEPVIERPDPNVILVAAGDEPI